MLRTVYACKKCGNPNVEGQTWFNLTTREVKEYCSSVVYCAYCHQDYVDTLEIEIDVSEDGEFEAFMARASAWHSAYVLHRFRMEHGDRIGNCYELSATHILDHGEDGWMLVHGRPTLQHPPYEKFGHAWIENDLYVMDLVTNATVPKSFYYQLGKIGEDECFRYSREMVREYVIEYKHYGPW